MTLANRVSLFFLGMLAVTLAGFSAVLYLLVAGYLAQQLNQQLEAALGTLSAVAELKDGGIEWEPQQRRLNLEAGVRWTVRAPGGLILDSSPDPIPPDLLEHSLFQGGATGQVRRAGWRISQLFLEPRETSRSAPQPGEHPGEVIYPALTITAAASTTPMDRSLRWLLGTLAALSVTVWTAAAVVGRRLCRRTLAPVSRMAESARSIPATEPGQRLHVDRTGDELEELGQAFNGLLDRLQEAFERQRRFTGEASHQLRTPLAILLGQVEVALRRDRPAEEYRRVLGIVADQAGRLHRIVEMLLFLARADAEAATPRPSVLDLRPWLHEQLQHWLSHPRSADIRLVAPEDECALAHPPLLGQVLDILLDNACKYSRPGTPITVSLQGTADHVLVSVTDAGCGIAPEDLPRVFDPFFRSPQLRQSETNGVGLGLAIARRVTAAMGAEITAANEPGQGSCFTVRLIR